MRTPTVAVEDSGMMMMRKNNKVGLVVTMAAVVDGTIIGVLGFKGCQVVARSSFVFPVVSSKFMLLYIYI